MDLILGTWNQALSSVTPCFKGVTPHKGLAELFWFCSLIPTPYHSKRIQKQMSLLKSKSQWVDISPMKQTSAEDRFHLITHPPDIHSKHFWQCFIFSLGEPYFEECSSGVTLYYYEFIFLHISWSSSCVFCQVSTNVGWVFLFLIYCKFTT